MQLSETVKLYPDRFQKELIESAMQEYVSCVNRIVSDAVSGISIAKLSSAGVDAALPSALKNQCIRDAKSIMKKHYKACHSAVMKNRRLAKNGKLLRVTAPALPVVKKPCCYINNQNFRIVGDNIEFPVLINGKSKRISVKAKITEHQKELFATKVLGTMRVVKKNRKLVAQVVYDTEEASTPEEGNILGIDLGIKCPAVSFCSDGSVKFYGNGRRNKYMRRHYDYLRQKAQKAKKLSAVIRLRDKEQRVMKDLDHKLSRQIVNEAASHKVSVIKLERLDNIRSAARKSRKNNHSLHSWSFYRLSQFIEYKAKLAGIAVEYVNPAYTSQKCPVCWNVQHADDRDYICLCGYHTHRDLLGAINICNSTEYAGNRHTAQGAICPAL